MPISAEFSSCRRYTDCRRPAKDSGSRWATRCRAELGLTASAENLCPSAAIGTCGSRGRAALSGDGPAHCAEASAGRERRPTSAARPGRLEHRCGGIGRKRGSRRRRRLDLGGCRAARRHGARRRLCGSRPGRSRRSSAGHSSGGRTDGCGRTDGLPVRPQRWRRRSDQRLPATRADRPGRILDYLLAVLTPLGREGVNLTAERTRPNRSVDELVAVRARMLESRHRPLL